MGLLCDIVGVCIFTWDLVTVRPGHFDGWLYSERIRAANEMRKDVVCMWEALDRRVARSVIDEKVEEINKSTEDTIARLSAQHKAAIGQSERLAPERTKRLAWRGLALIVVGFVLQVAGAILAR
jgi:hypothetical protein